MKKRLFIGLFVIFFLIFLLSIYIYKNDNIKFKFEYEIYNYFSYSNGKKIKTNININNNIKYLTGDEILNKLKCKKCVIYFGYPDCPWCRNVVPILIDTLDEYGFKDVYYINVHDRKNDRVFAKVIKKLDKYLDSDQNNNKKLYVPDVYFIKNGEVMLHHVSTIEGYNNPYSGMNKKQKNELKNIYIEGLNLIK